jgi:hypothetical protein
MVETHLKRQAEASSTDLSIWLRFFRCSLTKSRFTGVSHVSHVYHNSPEAWRHVHGHVPVPLLEPVVLLDVVQVIPSDDDSVPHLHLDDGAGEEAAANVHVAGERTLLVDVVALTSLYRNDERKLVTRSHTYLRVSHTHLLDTYSYLSRYILVPI